MTNQTLNDDSDIIEDVQDNSWTQGVCANEWAEPTLLLFSDGSVIQLTDGAVLTFKDY
jgi:hypothetical protein